MITDPLHDVEAPGRRIRLMRGLSYGTYHPTTSTWDTRFETAALYSPQTPVVVSATAGLRVALALPCNSTGSVVQ